MPDKQLDNAAKAAALNMPINWADHEQVHALRLAMKNRQWAVIFIHRGLVNEMARYSMERDAQSYAMRMWLRGRRNPIFQTGKEDRAAWCVVHEPSPEHSVVFQIYRADERI